jgi:hypothetical protein
MKTRANFREGEQGKWDKNGPEQACAGWSKHGKQQRRDAKTGENSAKLDRGEHCFNYR